jgi:pimeloyl-ACP methyl ester carboxylesterase
MSSIPLMDGVTSRMVTTPRLTMHVRFAGPEDGVPVLFIHGNASSATFWEEEMLALPAGFRAIAPDLRGYGDTEDKLIDATRGMGEWVDDLIGLMETLGIAKYHVAGHSLGGTIVLSLIPAAGASILSATLAAPGSPLGYGGSKGLDGAPTYADFAASGGGVVNPEFARLISVGDRGSDNPQASPRIVMNSFYWKPPFKPAREEELLSGVLSEKIGPDKYPGDFVPSDNWPGVAPGVHGPTNALSPKYVGDSVERLVAAAAKPHVLWVRGADDLIVGDMSLFDFGTLGKLGYVPGWPGEEIHPPQPMVAQTRAVLERYAAQGGAYEEVVLADCGHTPFLEKPEAFRAAFHALLRG